MPACIVATFLMVSPEVTPKPNVSFTVPVKSKLFLAVPRKPKKKPEAKKEAGEEPGSEPAEEKPEDEAEEAKPKQKFEKEIYPHSFIMLNCGEEFITHRYSGLAQKISVNQLTKQMEQYNMLNMIDMCSIDEAGLTVCNFFQEKKDEVLVSELRKDTDYIELNEAIRLYIERNGRPYNFLETEARVYNAREEAIVKKETEKSSIVHDKKVMEEEEEERKKKNREEKNRLRWKEISEHIQGVKEAQQISAR